MSVLNDSDRVSNDPHLKPVVDEKQCAVSVEPANDALQSTSERGLHARSLSFLDRIEHHADRYWLWEIIGLTGSAICIVLIGVIPSRYWYEEAPEWGATVHGKKGTISLNFLISWFSTIAKICLAMPITKGLGQMKWVWFSTQDRPLADFETYESATRGILGSTFLIWRFRARHFAVLGAITMILSVGFDPAVQNSLIMVTGAKSQKMNATVGDSNYVRPAWIGRALSWDVVNDQVGSQGLPTIDLSTKSRILAALYDTEAPVGAVPSWATPAYSCVSDNCLFSTHVTLASTARCVDVTSSPGCDVSLPNGMTLGGVNNSRTRLATFTTLAQSGLKPLVYTNYTTAFAIVQSISVNASDLQFTTRINASTRIVASECAIVPAAGLYHALLLTDSLPKANGADYDEFDTTTEGAFTGSYSDFLDVGSVNSDGALVFTPDYTTEPFSDVNYRRSGYGIGDGDLPLNTTQPKAISMSARSILAMQSYLPTILSGSYDVINKTKHYTDAFGHFSDAIQSIFESQPQTWNGLTWKPSNDHGSWVAGRVGLAASTAFRSAPVLAWLRPRKMALEIMTLSQTPVTPQEAMPPPALAIQGMIYRYVPVVTGQPFFLVLPAALWCLTLAFSIGVILRTRRSGARRWRTNPLAVVFLDIGDEERARIQSHDLTEKGLSRKAEGLRVRMRVERDGATLVS